MPEVPSGPAPSGLSALYASTRLAPSRLELKRLQPGEVRAANIEVVRSASVYFVKRDILLCWKMGLQHVNPELMFAVQGFVRCFFFRKNTEFEEKMREKMKNLKKSRCLRRQLVLVKIACHLPMCILVFNSNYIRIYHPTTMFPNLLGPFTYQLPIDVGGSLCSSRVT